MFDLDVDSPEKVANVLRRAADRFYQDAEELSSSWQDRGAGKPWKIIADELERAAVKITQRIQREYGRR